MIDFDKAMISAIESENLTFVTLLAEKFYKKNDYSDSKFLYNALISGCIDIVEYLLSMGADLDNIDILDAECIIFDCVKENYIEVIQLLLNEIEFDQEDIDKMFNRSEPYSEEFVELLINSGANVKKYGNKVYQKAKKLKNNTLAKYLKKNIKL